MKTRSEERAGLEIRPHIYIQKNSELENPPTSYYMTTLCANEKGKI